MLPALRPARDARRDSDDGDEDGDRRPKPAPGDVGLAKIRPRLLRKPPEAAARSPAAAPAAPRAPPCTRRAAAAAAGCCGTSRHRPCAILATSQFRDSRAMPTRKPRIVAKTMPRTATQQRVEEADEKGAAVAVVRACRGCRRLRDLEAGAVPRGSRSRRRCWRAADSSIVLLTIQPTEGDEDDRRAAPGRRSPRTIGIVERAKPRRRADRPCCRSRAVIAPDAIGTVLAAKRCEPGRSGRPGPPRNDLADRRGVLECRPCVHSAFRPRAIFSVGARADVALEDLAVIADRLDDVRRPVVGEADALAEGCRRCRAGA